MRILKVVVHHRPPGERIRPLLNGESVIAYASRALCFPHEKRERVRFGRFLFHGDGPWSPAEVEGGWIGFFLLFAQRRLEVSNPDAPLADLLVAQVDRLATEKSGQFGPLRYA